LLAIAADPASSGRTLWAISFRSIGHRAIRRALASNPSGPAALLRHLGRRGTWDVASAVAANPRCPRRLQSRLAVAPDWAVRASAAGNPATRPAVLRTFVTTSYVAPARVAMALATNPALTTGQVDRLLAHNSLFVRGVAARHQAASGQALARLADGLSEPAWVLRAIAANPSCPAELSDELLTWIALGGPGPADPMFDPVTCTGHPGDTGSTAGAWYAEQARDQWSHEHPLWRVRSAIGPSGRPVPRDQVKLLSRDPTAEVRESVTRMRTVPLSAMIELMWDDSPPWPRWRPPGSGRARASCESAG
jgi:hypothetical protein